MIRLICRLFHPIPRLRQRREGAYGYLCESCWTWWRDPRAGDPDCTELAAALLESPKFVREMEIEGE